MPNYSIGKIEVFFIHSIRRVIIKIFMPIQLKRVKSDISALINPCARVWSRGHVAICYADESSPTTSLRTWIHATSKQAPRWMCQIARSRFIRGIYLWRFLFRQFLPPVCRHRSAAQSITTGFPWSVVTHELSENNDNAATQARIWYPVTSSSNAYRHLLVMVTVLSITARFTRDTYRVPLFDWKIIEIIRDSRLVFHWKLIFPVKGARKLIYFISSWAKKEETRSIAATAAPAELTKSHYKLARVQRIVAVRKLLYI